LNNLAGKYPDRAKEMAANWEAWARRSQVLPWQSWASDAGQKKQKKKKG
jgi:hypothetical protein